MEEKYWQEPWSNFFRGKYVPVLRNGKNKYEYFRSRNKQLKDEYLWSWEAFLWFLKKESFLSPHEGIKELRFVVFQNH